MAPPTKLPRRPKSEYVIQTVVNALRLLETFSETEELGVTELSRRLSLHKNNVFRLLATLEERGYIDQLDDTDRYQLGSRCLELGHSFSRGRSLARHARAELERLAEATGESVHLGALRDLEVSHLDGEQSDQLILTGLRVGRRLPLHCTALGKVLLAAADKSIWERFDREFAPDGKLTRHTPMTITDRDKFFDHLQKVAGEGFALDSEEYVEGMICIAAPVYDAAGRTVAALSISAPSFRIDKEQLHQQLIPLVTEAAERLTARLH
ncbi:MAG: IclR family transcriptional regulator [bacterium]|nr:IclR family transcriptional regulator [bacterium]